MQRDSVLRVIYLVILRNCMPSRAPGGRGSQRGKEHAFRLPLALDVVNGQAGGWRGLRCGINKEKLKQPRAVAKGWEGAAAPCDPRAKRQSPWAGAETGRLIPGVEIETGLYEFP